MTPTSLQPALGTVRGVLLTAGIGLFTLVVPSAGGAVGFNIGLGIALQLLWWLAMRLAARYEQKQQLAGALTPVIALVLELVIDAVTIGLFSHAILHHWWQAGESL
ncbi:hypothetical protein HPT27_08910 [Permianibacter sp. IMCC34836]|uniref:hypothetical protein n=1 Tax=Permianibacter fluminis TaxID=2738515 RepID=UPI0015548444|nr:hypothetical protein [Permianibacter fluminis]NQD37144.1 hypothetical protein [Permianibacter fluminis]